MSSKNETSEGLFENEWLDAAVVGIGMWFEPYALLTLENISEIAKTFLALVALNFALFLMRRRTVIAKYAVKYW